MASHQSPFMRMPSEIRVEIYKLLLNSKDQQTLEIQTESLDTCRVISDVEFHPSIMSVNRQINDEVSFLLYNQHRFSFVEVETVLPFLSNLRARTRSLIHSICLLKQSSTPPHPPDWDLCEWSKVSEFIAKNMQLKSLKLIVEGGRPSTGFQGMQQYSVSEFRTLHKVKYEALGWVWELLLIKGLQTLEVVAEIHHCPPARSLAMAFCENFSASIENGFAEFLRSEMLAKV